MYRNLQIFVLAFVIKNTSEQYQICKTEIFRYLLNYIVSYLYFISAYIDKIENGCKYLNMAVFHSI